MKSFSFDNAWFWSGLHLMGWCWSWGLDKSEGLGTCCNDESSEVGIIEEGVDGLIGEIVSWTWMWNREEQEEMSFRGKISYLKMTYLLV